MIRWWTFRALGRSTAPIRNASFLTKGVRTQLMISDMLNASKYVFTKQAFLRDSRPGNCYFFPFFYDFDLVFYSYRFIIVQFGKIYNFFPCSFVTILPYFLFPILQFPFTACLSRVKLEPSEVFLCMN